MPLLDRDAHSELTQAFEIFDKSFKGRVALGVKFAVLEELIHGLLLAAFEHLFEKREFELGDE